MNVAKRRRFLSPRWISELVWDSESEEDTAASSETTSEDEGCFQNEPAVSPATGPPDIQWSSVRQFDRHKCFLIVFRLDQISSGHRPLALRQLSFTPLQGGPG